MNDRGEEMVHPVDANVDGEHEADNDLVCKYNGCLHHMEAVSCKSCWRHRPARVAQNISSIPPAPRRKAADDNWFSYTFGT